MSPIYSKDVTKIFQRCHQSIPKMSPKYSKDVTNIFQRCHQSIPRCHQNIPKMSPKYSKDVTKILHFSAHKNIYWCFFMPNFSFNNSLLKRPKVNTHLDRVVFTIIINFQKSKTFIYVKKI